MKAREKLVTRTFVPHPDLHDAGWAPVGLREVQAGVPAREWL